MTASLSILFRVSTYAVAASLGAVAFGQQPAGPDDHGDDPSTATGLNLGETAAGEINTRYDEDYFRLDLPSRARLEISGMRDGLGLSTTLFELQGGIQTCLAIHNHGSRATRRALAEGTYYLQVSSFGQGRFYEVGLREVGPDDHGDMPETATALTPGETVNGVIDPAGDTDFFRVDLSERTTLEVSGVDVERSQAVRICEPERRDFDFALTDGVGEAGWSRRELEAGTYYLAVRSRGLAGAYEIGVRNVGPDDHGDSPASATQLALGETAEGDIEPRGDLDYFRFDLPRPMDVTVSATADAGIDLMLTDANGVYPLTEEDGQGGLRLRAVLDAGNHYLRMWRPDEAPIGSYEVAVHGTPADDHGNSEGEATAITLAAAVAGEINPHDDLDYFRFELAQRATVVVATTGVAEFGALIDADGEVLSEMEWLPERSEFQMRGDLDAGVYYVGLASDGTTGRYEMAVREAEPDDHGNRPDTATAVVLGGLVEGAVERRDDVDYFRLNLVRPVVVSVSVTSNFENAELHLLDAEGARLQEGYGTARMDLHTRAELGPGTYYVVVASYMSVTSLSYSPPCSPPQHVQRSGRYRLNVWEVAPDDHGGLSATATDVQLDAAARGVIGSIVGEIHPREDRDVFRLELARPIDLIVDVAASFRLLARLLDEDGAEIDAEMVTDDGGLEEVVVLTEVCDDWTMKLVEPNSADDQLQLRYEAQPGVYYLELWSARGAGYYEIELREPGSGDR